MDRRGFLRALLSGAAGAAAAHTLDLDRLLWVPGARTFFLPSPSYTYTLLTTDLICRDALRVLEQNLRATCLINREYDARFAGTVLTVQSPPRYLEDRETGIRVRIPDIARQYRKGMSHPSNMEWIG
jgi:hypothetical protein